MPRPDISLEQIEVPSIDTPMAGFAEQACGQSYHTYVDVHQVYKGIDAHSYSLQPRSELLTPTEASKLTADQRAQMAPDAGLVAQTIIAAQRMLDGQDPKLPVRIAASGGGLAQQGVATVVDAKNREAIQHLIDRATYYGGIATQLWNFWAEEWQPHVIKQLDGGRPGTAFIQAGMPHWPLDKTLHEALPLCGAASQGAEIQWPGPDWTALVACPNTLAQGMHAGDVLLFQELIHAAMLWARCAQEAAAVVGVHYLNKAEYDAQQGGGFQIAQPEPAEYPDIADPGPPPPPPDPGGDLAPQPPGPGEPPGPGPELPDPTGGEGEDEMPPEPVPDNGVPAPTEDYTPAPRGLAALPMPVKVAGVLGLLYIASRALK